MELDHLQVLQVQCSWDSLSSVERKMNTTLKFLLWKCIELKLVAHDEVNLQWLYN